MAIPNLANHVTALVDFKKFYQSYFPDWDGNHNSNVSCPFSSKHTGGKDSKPSFSVNINNTGGCFCQSCGTKVGSIIHFVKLLNKGLDDESAASLIYSNHIRPVQASPAEVAATLQPWETAMQGAPKVFSQTKKDLSINDSTLERFDIGWNPSKRRLTIPIFDTFGQLLNTRLYRLPSMRDDDKFPKLLNSDGFGAPAEMFPAPTIQSICKGNHKPPQVFWMSGERDTLLAWDRGVPSFCYTTGENVCKTEWAETIRALHCEIVIVQDNDGAGGKGAEKRLEMLVAAGIPAKILHLPLDLQGKKVKDFSDFILNGGTIQDFLVLAKSKNGKKPHDNIPIPEETPRDGEPQGGNEYHSIPRIFDPQTLPVIENVQVSEIGRSPQYQNKPTTVKAIVSGKTDRTYSIPEVIEVGAHQYRIPISREMLQLVRANDSDIEKIIRGWLNTKARVVILKTIAVTEVEIIPMIQPGVETSYVNQRCYYFGQMIECNKPYLMGIIPTTDMKSQEAVGLIVEIEPISNILDSYNFSDENCKMLADNFAIAEDADPYENLCDLSHSLATHFTHIFNREDVHLSTLLSWLSPLQFNFPCEGIQRGWLNTLILGDTETGKSKICQKLTALFHCGVFINAESCSYVGLVGGAVKSSSGMFILRWGKIPLYHRQLVVVEELSGLSTEEISYMSDIRSAGVARYDKAGLSGETAAKTRLVFLSNVRGKGRSIEDYPTGVEAARDLIGHHEDLARFDLVLTAVDDEVNKEVINQDRTLGELKVFTEEEQKAFRELIMFAWSLKPDQIEFTVEAYRECLTQTIRMSGVYHPSLPVFKAGSGRLKLARVACAVACAQFAWDNGKKKLVITKKHVICASQILEHHYQKPSFGYARYSRIQHTLSKVIDEDKVIAKIKESFPEKEQDFFAYISHSSHFSKFEIGEAMGVHFLYVERVISQMFLSNLLKKGEDKSQWQLSKGGRKWVDKQIVEASSYKKKK